MIIYTNEGNLAGLKLIIAAKLSEKSVEVKIVEANDKSLKPPRLLPYLEVNDENLIFMPNAAVSYLLSQETSQEIDREWLEWESTIMMPHLTFYNEPQKVLTEIERLNGVLEKNRFLLGDKVSACDIAIFSTLYGLFSNLSPEKRAKNVAKWFEDMLSLPQVKAALEQYPLAKGSAPYSAYSNGLRLSSTKSSQPVSSSKPDASQSSPQHQAETVPDEELEAARKAWSKSSTQVPKVLPTPEQVLPKKNQRNILITSALPYVNNVPHLGNIIGCVLSADVFARYCRICNYNTLYIGGTDEYGTATETKALEEGMSCQAICDKYYAIHRDIYEWFDISFNYFGRSSTPEQTEICQNMFLQLNENGFMFTEAVEQLHCEKCDRFLADRFVEGGCPHAGCTYEDARGDQCDGCGKLVNATELKNPRCKICSNTPKLRTSKQFFIDLPKLEPLLLHWQKKSAPGWSSNAQVIGKAWLREGLKPRCITRDLKWGVPVPLKEFSSKVFYVWFDAPIGYMSMTKGYTKAWTEWWQPKKDAEVTLYQFMAKDNVPFHSVMFPACLMGANKGYVTVSHIMATEYLNYEDGKFSKSRGVGVFGNDARDTGIPSDMWRFYLLFVRPESQDSSFSWADLATKINSELLNNLGNFVNRALVFAKNNFGRTVPEMVPNRDDFQLLALCTRELRNYVGSLEKARLRDGIRHILSISRLGNQYMQANQPWVLLKGSAAERERAGTVVGICCNLACLLAILLHPYMPATSDNLNKQLNVVPSALTPEYVHTISNNVEIVRLLAPGHALGEPAPLFAKLEPAVVDELKKKFGGRQSSAPEKSKDGGGVPGNDVKSLEEAVARQGDKVRALKQSGADRKAWQPEVGELLELKKRLEVAQKMPQNGGGGLGIGDDAKSLEEEVAKQALIVRKLKEGGASKADWQPEVGKLLELKKKLAEALGAPPAENDGKKKKKK